MSKIKVSIVSYLNSKPFIYGLQHHNIIKDIELSLDTPADCANKLLNGTVDLGLIPVAVIPEMEAPHIITNFCIGAVGAVHSVMLYSKVPMREITHVYLDSQSRTSVQLTKVLAKNYWSISPTWLDTKEGFEQLIDNTAAAVVIGDRALALAGKHEYAYDLAEEWQGFTDLPFTFACWVSNKLLPDTFIIQFNEACALGVNNIDKVISEYKNQYPASFDIENYLKHHISYDFSIKKKQAMGAFWDFTAKL